MPSCLCTRGPVPEWQRRVDAAAQCGAGASQSCPGDLHDTAAQYCSRGIPELSWRPARNSSSILQQAHPRAVLATCTTQQLNIAAGVSQSCPGDLHDTAQYCKQYRKDNEETYNNTFIINNNKITLFNTQHFKVTKISERAAVHCGPLTHQCRALRPSHAPVPCTTALSRTSAVHWGPLTHQCCALRHSHAPVPCTAALARTSAVHCNPRTHQCRALVQHNNCTL